MSHESFAYGGVMTHNIFVKRDHVWFAKGRFFVGQKAFILRKDGEERVVLIKKIVGNEDGYDIATFKDVTPEYGYPDHGCSEADLY